MAEKPQSGQPCSFRLLSDTAENWRHLKPGGPSGISTEVVHSLCQRQLGAARSVLVTEWGCDWAMHFRDLFIQKASGRSTQSMEYSSRKPMTRIQHLVRSMQNPEKILHMTTFYVSYTVAPRLHWPLYPASFSSTGWPSLRTWHMETWRKRQMASQIDFWLVDLHWGVQLKLPTLCFTHGKSVDEALLFLL